MTFCSRTKVLEQKSAAFLDVTNEASQVLIPID
jgi:hypothetical protein